MRTAPAHLAIGGLTPRVERDSTHHKNSGTAKIAVFIRLNHPAVAIPITGTRRAPFTPTREFKKDDGTTFDAMGGKEYSSVVKSALPQLSSPSRSRCSSMRGQVSVLLHDRDPSHTSSLVKAMAEEEGLKIVTLPSHCPDLTPHDATFLGCVKREWHRRCVEGRLPWGERAQLFLQLLQNQDPSPHILRWKRSLHACIEAEGAHIERQLQRKCHT